MSSLTVGLVLVLSILVLIPVFVIGMVADAINRWYKERDDNE